MAALACLHPQHPLRRLHQCHGPLGALGLPQVISSPWQEIGNTLWVLRRQADVLRAQSEWHTRK